MIVARSIAAYAPQVKPKAYLPTWAFIPALVKRSRASTKVTLMSHVRVELWGQMELMP